MDIGVPREIKDNEFRVALVPEGARALREAGHRVYVEAGAGFGSSIADSEYEEAGAVIKATAAEVYGKADFIIKVKEPLYKEYRFLRDGMIVFTFLHLAANESLVRSLLRSGGSALAYETLETDEGRRPLLDPMSEIAGKLSVQIGARYLQRPEGGAGVLLGGARGAEKGLTVILGAGMVGSNAAGVAHALGSKVILMDRDRERLEKISSMLAGAPGGGGVTILETTPENIGESITTCDLLIGAVHATGRKTPRLVTRDMVGTMKKGSVVVDVSVDQGGCIETTHPTTHSNPVYDVDGVLHYGVANMPGAVPRTATFALTEATLPYIMKIAGLGLKGAAREDPAIRRAVNIMAGRITNRGVAEAMGREYAPYKP